MKRIVYPALSVIGMALVLALVPEPTSANDKLNFSGNYVVERGEKVPNGTPSTLEIVQSDDSIEITRVKLGKSTVSHCPLDGSDGDYTSPYGGSGKCRAQLKPKYLILESVVSSSVGTRPQHAVYRMRTKEKWQLSGDAKTLTIKSDIDFPDSRVFVVSDGVIVGAMSETVKYKRTNP